MNFEAVFSSVKYNLSFNVEGKGTVEQEIASSDNGKELTLGAKVNLKAIPAADHSFFFWNDNIKDTINPIQVTIDENKTIDAKFDFKTAKDLVGTWEFELEDSGSSRSHNKMIMTIDIRLNILITPPTSAITSSTTGDVNPNQALTNVVSQVANTPAACTISSTLTSGSSVQTVSATTALSDVVYTFSTTCSGTLTAFAEGLPNGVNMAIDNNVATNMDSNLENGSLELFADNTKNQSIQELKNLVDELSAQGLSNPEIQIRVDKEKEKRG